MVSSGIRQVPDVSRKQRHVLSNADPGNQCILQANKQSLSSEPLVHLGSGVSCGEIQRQDGDESKQILEHTVLAGRTSKADF